MPAVAKRVVKSPAKKTAKRRFKHGETNDDEFDEMDGLVPEVADLKDQIKTLEAELATKTARLIELMSGYKRKSHSVRSKEHPEYKITATLVEAVRLVTDEGRLRKALGATLWQKVSRRVLDKGKLESAVAEGTVDANVVANATDEVPNAPYIRTSRSK